MFHRAYGEVTNSSDTTTSKSASRFQICQYNPKSALRKRLRKDVRLWLKIATDSGLRHMLHPYGEHKWVQNEKIEIACTLLGFLKQPRPRIARVLAPKRNIFDHLVMLRKHCLWIGSEVKLAIHFLHQLQAVGFNLDFDDDTAENHSLSTSLEEHLAEVDQD